MARRARRVAPSSVRRKPGQPGADRGADDSEEAGMGAKNRGGKEARKPKAEKNIKVKGQTPAPASAARTPSR